MASLHPLFRAFTVYAIYDAGRDCFLGRDGDHWMIISRQQFQDLLLFATAQEAWDEIDDRPGLRVRALVVDIEPGPFARREDVPFATPAMPGTGATMSTIQRA